MIQNRQRLGHLWDLTRRKTAGVFIHIGEVTEGKR